MHYYCLFASILYHENTVYKADLLFGDNAVYRVSPKNSPLSFYVYLIKMKMFDYPRNPRTDKKSVRRSRKANIFDPPGPDCRISGPYFHTWCPYVHTFVHPENKNTHTTLNGAWWVTLKYYEIFPCFSTSSKYNQMESKLSQHTEKGQDAT